jgi:hypothetical protein
VNLQGLLLVYVLFGLGLSPEEATQPNYRFMLGPLPLSSCLLIMLNEADFAGPRGSPCFMAALSSLISADSRLSPLTCPLLAVLPCYSLVYFYCALCQIGRLVVYEQKLHLIIQASVSCFVVSFPSFIFHCYLKAQAWRLCRVEIKPIKWQSDVILQNGCVPGNSPS